VFDRIAAMGEITAEDAGFIDFVYNAFNFFVLFVTDMPQVNIFDLVRKMLNN
jgi:hypothetical protein